MSESSPAASGAAELSQESFTFPALVKIEPEEHALPFDHEVIVKRVKSEPEQLLYADHEIKEEMVIGPTEVRRPVREFCRDYNIAAPSAIKTSSLEYENARLYHCRVELRDARELQCAECGQWSLTAAELQRHKRMHTGKGNESVLIQPEERQTERCNDSIKQPKLSKDKGHPCDQCDRQFPFKCDLIRHLYTHNRVGRFVCNICGKDFNQSSHFYRHLSTVHRTIKKLACDICKKEISGTNVLQNFKNHRFACNKNFLRNAKLNHLNMHGGVKPFACNTCEKRFSCKTKLTRHLAIHSNARFVCDICNKRFQIKSSLINHLNIHMGVKPFACNTCEKRFSCQDYLARHLATHSERKRRFECNTCDQKFFRKGDLKSHLNVHNAVKSHFECHICEKKYTSKSGLYQHLIIHKAKRFACNICEKKFHSKLGLNSHLLSHSAVKNFKCNICDNVSFKCTKSLIDHLKRVHVVSTGKNFVCDICDRVFDIRSGLISHMNIHSSVKNFESNGKTYCYNSHCLFF